MKIVLENYPIYRGNKNDKISGNPPDTKLTMKQTAKLGVKKKSLKNGEMYIVNEFCLIKMSIYFN